MQLADHAGHTVDLLKVEEPAMVAQGLAAELDEYALVLCHTFHPFWRADPPHGFAKFPYA